MLVLVSGLCVKTFRDALILQHDKIDDGCSHNQDDE